MNKTASLLLLFLLVTSSLVTAMSYVGNYFEQVLEFLAAFITFLLITGLFAKVKRVEIFSRPQLKIMCITFLSVFVIKEVYMLYEYSDQTLPSGYFFTITIQALLNLLIVKVLLHD